MTTGLPEDSITTAAEGGDNSTVLALPVQQKVVLVMDLVESVRLMADNEASVIGHWRSFVRHATNEVLPSHSGRLVKSLGDGIMAEFDSAHAAARVALALHKHFDEANAGLPANRRMYLRAGLNATSVYVDDIDIYGAGVNLAARVASLAGPGETMVTASVRDELVEGLDAVVEDMGECYLKHVAQPVRAYRIGPPGPQPLLTPAAEYLDPLHPKIAVVPFQSRVPNDQGIAVGDLIADGVIAHLGVNSALRVVSGLSTHALSSRPEVVQLVKERLGAEYVLAGSYVLTGQAASASMVVQGSLIHADSGEVVWVDRFSVPLSDLCAVESEGCQRLASGVHAAIFEREARRAIRQPLPTLASYSLLLSGIKLMHRSTSADMVLSRRMLEHLAERHPRLPDPHAWLAKSFVINAVSSSSPVAADTERARVMARDALERFQDHALSLAVHAHVLTHLEDQPERALEKLEAALQVNYNEPMAWLFKSVLSAMWGDTAKAVTEAAHAHTLSPADPLAYYFQMIQAAACTANQDYVRGIACARESLRLNRHHTPTWRVLITAQVFAGDLPGAAASAQEMLKLDPSFSLRAYQSARTAASRTRRHFVAAAMEIPSLKAT